MYADRVLSGSKRSVKDRLDTDFAPLNRQTNTNTLPSKRQRQNDDKWKHDLYHTNQLSNPTDLRLKLQNKGRGHLNQTLNTSTTRPSNDLRNKLSGSVHAQPLNNQLPQSKEVVEVTKPLRENVSVEVPAPETKKATNPASRKKSQHKAEGSSSSVDSLLQSLGLEKYSITFQAEEIDMTALMHMNDEDLKVLGIPMGPRKKIILALDSRA